MTITSGNHHSTTTTGIPIHSDPFGGFKNQNPAPPSIQVICPLWVAAAMTLRVGPGLTCMVPKAQGVFLGNPVVVEWEKG